MYSPAWSRNCESPPSRSFGAVAVAMASHHVDACCWSRCNFKSGNVCGKSKSRTIFFRTLMWWKCSRFGTSGTNAGWSAEPSLSWWRAVFNMLSMMAGRWLVAVRWSPDFLRLSFTSPPIGLVGNIWTSVQSRSIEPTMHGIRNQKNHSFVFVRGSWYKQVYLEDKQREPKSGN